MARRDYSGDDVNADEWARVFATFRPRVSAIAGDEPLASKRLDLGVDDLRIAP